MVTTYLSRPGHCTHLARLQAKILFKVAILFLFCFVFFLPPNLFFKLFEELKPNDQSVGIRVEESGLGMGRRAFRLTSVSSGGTSSPAWIVGKLPCLIFTSAEGWWEEEMCTTGLSDGQKEGGGGKGRGNEYYACLRSFLVWETVFAHKRSCWLVRFSSTCQSLAKLLHDYLAGKTKESELVQRRSCQFRFRSRGSSLEKPNFFFRAGSGCRQIGGIS